MRYHIALISLILLEGLAGYWLVNGGTWLRVTAGLCHCLIVATSFMAFKKIHMPRFAVGNNFLIINTAVSFALPVYGLLGMYLALLAADRAELVPTDYFETLIQEEMPARFKLLASAIHHEAAVVKREQLNIEAFRDIFKSNDRLLEENAVNKLAKILTRDSVSILKEVVRHATSDTRVLAATALIEMEDKVIEKIEGIRNALGEDQTNPGLVLQLARSYDLYCYLGVLDEAITHYYRMQAAEQYKTFLVLRPKDPQATFEYGRVLLNSEQHDRAIEVLTEAIRLDPGNPNPHVWLAEAHYELGEYEKVATICRRINNYSNLPENVAPVTSWWAEETSWLVN